MSVKCKLQMLAREIEASANFDDISTCSKDTILGCIAEEYIEFSQRIYAIAKEIA